MFYFKTIEVSQINVVYITSGNIVNSASNKDF